MSSVRSLVPARIYKARLRNGMTQEGLAEAIRARGVKATERYVRRWEKGVNVPRADVVPALAAALGVTIDSLYGDNGDDEDDEDDPVGDLMRALNRWHHRMTSNSLRGGPDESTPGDAYGRRATHPRRTVRGGVLDGLTKTTPPVSRPGGVSAGARAFVAVLGAANSQQAGGSALTSPPAAGGTGERL